VAKLEPRSKSLAESGGLMHRGVQQDPLEGSSACGQGWLRLWGGFSQNPKGNHTSNPREGSTQKH